MKMPRPLLFATLLLLGLLLSACGGGFGASSWPGVTYDEASNTIYAAYNQHVYAIQAENGVEAWRFPAEPENSVFFYAPPTLTEDGQLLVSGYNNRLYSLDPASNGQTNWTFAGAGNRFVASAASSTDVIFAPNSDRRLYALSAEGNLQWTFGTSEAQWAAPAVNGGAVYLPSMDHNLYAVDSQSGSLLWEQDMGGTIVGVPALSEDGMLYVGTFGAEVLAVRASNGVVQWRAATEDWVWGGPSILDGVVYATDLAGNVYAFDAESGNELWQAAAGSAITGAPLVANEHVYVGTESGDVVAIDLTGRIAWTVTLDGQAYGSPVAAGELIVVGLVESESDSVLAALDAANGNRIWEFIP